MFIPESFRTAEISYRQDRIAGDVARGRPAASTRRGGRLNRRLFHRAPSVVYRAARARS